MASLFLPRTKNMDYNELNYSKKGEKMKKKSNCMGILFDFVMTILTGGLWLIWVLIRYLRTH
jgi:hypothetical protein